MKTRLEGLKRGSILQYHVNENDPETFVVGAILEVFEDFFLIQSISPLGQWDGFALYPMSDLVSIEQNTVYLKKLERLLQLRNQSALPQPKRKTTGIETILSYAKEKCRVVALELYKSGDRDVIGYVPGKFDPYIYIKQVNDFGQWDGISYVKSTAVTRIYLGDAHIVCLELLSSQDKRKCIHGVLPDRKRD